MPVYEVKDSLTQNTLRLEGDSPPTQAELEQIFTAYEGVKTSSRIPGQVVDLLKAGAPGSEMAREQRESDKMPMLPGAAYMVPPPQGFRPATKEERAGAIEGTMEPLTPRVDENDPKFISAVSGLIRARPTPELVGKLAGIINTARGMTSPAAIASVATGTALGKLASTLIGLGWGVAMGKDIPAAWKATKTAESPQEKTEAALRLGLDVAAPITAGLHAATVLAPKTTAAVQGPLATGEVLPTPKGAPAPRIEAPAARETVPAAQAAAASEAMTAEATAAHEVLAPLTSEAVKPLLTPVEYSKKIAATAGYEEGKILVEPSTWDKVQNKGFILHHV